MQTNKEKIEHLWSESFWREEATRIELEYYKIIKPLLPSPAVPPHTKSEHRIEDFVRELSSVLGIANLHVGLTSSDLEDNIRAERINRSRKIVADQLGVLIGRLKQRMDETPIIAYTHLLPAGVTTLKKRFIPQITILGEVLESSLRMYNISYKGIGGALGDGHIQRLLGVDTSFINEAVFPGETISPVKSQTVHHMAELYAAEELVRMASSVAKIANDIRLMFALGQAKHTQEDIGSTAIAAKAPNPWRYERVSGMAEQIYDLVGKVARVAANCNLERTLTNQSVLSAMFKDAYLVISSILEDMGDAMLLTKFVDQTKECKKPYLHSEEEMLGLIKRGVPRLEAHRRINKKYAKGI